jgi:hypothetical protein
LKVISFHGFPFISRWSKLMNRNKNSPVAGSGEKNIRIADVPTSFPRGYVANAAWAGDLAYQQT